MKQASSKESILAISYGAQLESLHSIFKMRATAALVVPVAVDALDYVAPCYLQCQL
jgi:hypothetical protein